MEQNTFPPPEDLCLLFLLGLIAGSDRGDPPTETMEKIRKGLCFDVLKQDRGRKEEEGAAHDRQIGVG